MTNWNPVEGLAPIQPERVRINDVVVIHDTRDDTFKQLTVRDKDAVTEGYYKLYLLDRPLPEEPHNVGTIIKSTRENSYGDKVYYARTVDGLVDADQTRCHVWVKLEHNYDVNDDYWSSEEYTWAQIVNRSTEGSIEVVQEGISLPY